jgi:hypothetical protein
MKNIHLLPTDKPSRLFLKEKMLLFNNQYRLQEVFPKGKCQHIYITSDEQIKEGDWCYDKVLNLIFQTDNHTDFKYVNQTDNVLKIILTTDQDLINDGVQAIDDKFLDWFVKNASCQSVEVRKEKIILGEVAGTTYTDFNYKIIIPQEEPKQETLEEAAEKLFPIFQRSTPFGDKYPWTPHKEREAFKRGAKWQAKNTCKHNYILTSENGHRVIKCLNCNHIQII